MNRPIELSILLPSYLEANNLKELLPDLVSTASSITPDYEIIIIDSVKSLDDTQKVCASFSNVTCISRSPNNTYGDAVRTGITHSRGKYVVFMDADCSHYPGFIHKLYALRNDYDVVIASRYMPGGVPNSHFMHLCMSRLLNFVYRNVLDIQLYDMSNSYKLYHGDQLRSLKLKCMNFDVIEEIIYRLQENYQARIYELPYDFQKRKHGTTKRNHPLFIASYLMTLFRLKFSNPDKKG